MRALSEIMVYVKCYNQIERKSLEKNVCVKLVDCGFEKNYEGLQRLINEHKSSRGEEKKGERL